ncbi:carboxypeptidase regulatory-like domain-containing protein [Leptolyngbya sp. FACHB-16]|nr:carboxypeptidase regulatory-like domain-containing protein [Leptolyngbya sp. FACHB-16]
MVGMAEGAIAHGAVLTHKTTQAYEIIAAYDNGDPMKNAQIAIFSPNDPVVPWKTATTDEEGRFLFSPPSPGSWEVQVRQAGHGDLLVIAVDDPATAQTDGAAAQKVVPQTEEATAPSGTINPLQKGLMAGSVIWGFVGTALFFSHGKKR